MLCWKLGEVKLKGFMHISSILVFEVAILTNFTIGKKINHELFPFLINGCLFELALFGAKLSHNELLVIIMSCKSKTLDLFSCIFGHGKDVYNCFSEVFYHHFKMKSEKFERKQSYP